MPCPEQYKNLGLASFGEQKYVTADMLRQFCMNDAYLKAQVDDLKYLSPPAVRKRFTPIPVDEANSFGYKITTDNTVVFDTATSKEIQVDFTDDSLIDISKTTCCIESILQDGEMIHQAKVPQKTTSTVDGSTRNYSPWAVRDSTGKIISGDMTANEHWYIGFDKNRHYETRPNWLQNELNNEIPSIGRAQTFKANVSGLLESIVLNIKPSPGEDRHNTASPLYVQIRKTTNKNGILSPDEVWCDYEGKYSVMAQQKVRFHNSSPDIVTILFDNPCTVNAGETYAIVLLSPLSHSSHCYWVGGWNKHCHADVYPDGNAFYTYNNGMSWIRYGKDDDVEYHQGRYAPQDFAFQCNIKKFKTGYEKNKDYWLYLAPIFSNPVKSVLLSANDTGDTAEGTLQLEYQVSNNGRDWHTVGDSHRYTFDSSDLRNVLFVRVRLRTTVDNETPLIENLTVLLDTEVPDEMYVRTCYYYPKTSAILGANVWGRLNAPYTLEPTVTGEVEIIRDKEVTEHFVIIEPNDLPDYIWVEEVDENKVTGKTEEQLIKYLEDTPSVVSALQEHQVYVQGFFDRLKFVNGPASPILNCAIQPNTGTTVVYGEWYDFTVDYTNDELIFFDDVLEDMPTGTFNISYNPLFIDKLTSEEMPLVLDYFQEEFIITNEIRETTRLKLRTAPVDPIRDVIINPEMENEQSLKEDVDYHVDYNNKEIVFDILNAETNETILSVNDIVRVVYTPNLDDSGISIGYHLTRTNTDKQGAVQPNYIEYKT